MRRFSFTKRGSVTILFQKKTIRLLLLLVCSLLLLSAAAFIFRLRAEPEETASAAVDPDIAAMNTDMLKKQISLVTEKLQQLDKKQAKLFPSGPAILVDSAANQISLLRNSKVVIQDKCSTGMGFELTDASGQRSWTFDTPRGYFKVTGKVADPIWIRPDWSFIEEGIPIPKKRSEREEANVLGDYAIAFGNGYFIHGTLYTRLLGTSVTHGCVRVGDDTLKKIYQAVQIGTPIWIY
jgi:L,D-transpeptidase ErfK/SrfK